MWTPEKSTSKQDVRPMAIVTDACDGFNIWIHTRTIQCVECAPSVQWIILGVDVVIVDIYSHFHTTSIMLHLLVSAAAAFVKNNIFGLYGIGSCLLCSRFLLTSCPPLKILTLYLYPLFVSALRWTSGSAKVKSFSVSSCVASAVLHPNIYIVSRSPIDPCQLWCAVCDTSILLVLCRHLICRSGDHAVVPCPGSPQV